MKLCIDCRWIQGADDIPKSRCGHTLATRIVTSLVDGSQRTAYVMSLSRQITILHYLSAALLVVAVVAAGLLGWLVLHAAPFALGWDLQDAGTGLVRRRCRRCSPQRPKAGQGWTECSESWLFTDIERILAVQSLHSGRAGTAKT